MLNIKPIVETSLSRVITHFQDTGFAILSADKWDKTPEQNKANFVALKADVANAGYGYVPTRGYYTYKDESNLAGEKITAAEDSVLIPNKARVENAEPLYDLVRRLGERYNQETVIYAPNREEKTGVLLLMDPRTGEIKATFDWLAIKDIADAWSKLRRGTHAAQEVKFVFEMRAVFNNPRSFGEALMRQKDGAIIDIEGYMSARLASGRSRVGRLDAAVDSLVKED